MGVRVSGGALPLARPARRGRQLPRAILLHEGRVPEHRARRPKHRNLPAVLCVIAGVALLAVGAALLLGERSGVDRYAALARDTRASVSDPAAVGSTGPGQGNGGDAAAGRDWDKILSENPEVAAWVSVANTDVDYPVMLPSEDKPADWYLRRDLWGDYSLAGTPYLERGTTATTPHSLVFGHHMASTGGMFTQLADDWDQGRFDEIGDLTWETPDGASRDLVPLFSMKVNKWYQPIQRTDLSDTTQLRSWLREVGADAWATADDWQGKADRATKAVTLVTCASAIADRDTRTVTVFVSLE